jgi:hypothetical protein
MASYRIDTITRNGENVDIGYSIIFDETAFNAAQAALATANANLDMAKTAFAAAQARWEAEALPSLPPAKIEEIRRVVMLAQSALNKAQTAQAEAQTKSKPDGGQETTAIAVSEIEGLLAAGDYATTEQALFARLEPEVKAKIRRNDALQSAFNAIGAKQLGRVIKV